MPTFCMYTFRIGGSSGFFIVALPRYVLIDYNKLNVFHLHMYAFKLRFYSDCSYVIHVM